MVENSELNGKREGILGLFNAMQTRIDAADPSKFATFQTRISFHGTSQP